MFENFVIADIQKQFYNNAKPPAIYFWRNSHGHEIDCLIDQGTQLLPIEIKVGMTLNMNFLDGLTYWLDLSGEQKGMLIYGGDSDATVHNITVKSWKNFQVL